MRAMAVAGVVAGALVGSCASLSEEECLSADWRTIGYEDGARGRTADHIAAHREACAEVGVVPDLEAWAAGRRAGLPNYCTPANVYEVGRSGRRLSPVCPAAQAARLGAAHEAGLRHHEIGREIREVERDMARAERRLDEIAGDDSDAAAAERARLRRELDRAGRALRRLEREQARYADWE